MMDKGELTGHSADWYPTLSLQERDRRWARTREFMKTEGLDCLLIVGLESRQQLQRYLTNDHTGGYVIFPRDGDLTYLAWTASRVTSHLQAVSQGDTPWIGDSRVGANGRTVVAVLREKGLDRSTIGVVGLGGSGGRETEGWIPYAAWRQILEGLPDATFSDVTQGFAELGLVKSDEELDVIRRAAAVGEKAAEAMLKVTGPGVSESEIAAAVMSVIYRHGAAGERGYIILHSGPDNPSWGPPLWLIRPERPRVVQAGDVVQAEIFPKYGDLEAQVQMSIALKPVHPLNGECAALAREAYEAGLEALRPGKTFAEVAEAMAAPLLRKGAWNLTPLIHSLSPAIAVGGRGQGLAQLPGIAKYQGMESLPIARVTRGDLVIRKGMTFEFEPNACMGKHRVNIGGTVIVGDEGVEELNSVSTEMRVL